MKVGTDGVLLGAWTRVQPSDRRILDIGTGTGLIALMLAQRIAGGQITGVDVDDVSQARENAAASPWADRVVFEQYPVQKFAPAERFDLIVSNPPFFVDSLTCPDQGRTAARHAVLLSYDDLCDAVIRLMAPGGRFAVILPTLETAHFIALATDRLCLTYRTDVRTTPRRPVKRVLMEFVAASALPAPATLAPATLAPATLATAGLCAAAVSAHTVAAPLVAPVCSELVIGTGEHECYTPQYRALTRDFYLKF